MSTDRSYLQQLQDGMELRNNSAATVSAYRNGKKWQTVNGDYSAMRKFYEHVLGQEWEAEHLPRSRKERALPGILFTEEVERLISYGHTLKLPSLGHGGLRPKLPRCIPGRKKPLGAIAWLEEKPYIVVLSKKRGADAFLYSMQVSRAAGSVQRLVAKHRQP